MLNSINPSNQKQKASFGTAVEGIGKFRYNPFTQGSFRKIDSFIREKVVNDGKNGSIKFLGGVGDFVSINNIAAKFQSGKNPNIVERVEIKLNTLMPFRSFKKLIAKGTKALARAEAEAKIVPININAQKTVPAGAESVQKQVGANIAIHA